MFNLERKTKIIATLGPATFSRKKIKDLLTKGVNIFRINFSHSNYSEAEEAITSVRLLSRELRKNTAVLIDLQGPKIRIGSFKNQQAVLTEGGKFTVTIDEILGDENRVATNYRAIVDDAQEGNLILLDDGKIQLKVINKDRKNVYCRVITGGILSDHKGMNLPGMKLSAPALTEKDRQDVLFGISKEIDYFALSFVRTPADVAGLRKFLTENNSNVKIIAKIEKPEALQNIAEIISLSDAVMVARGDLGVEMAMEKVPQVQKDIIRQANFKGKPVIVATQMLESMIHSLTPTRAEVSDVATAIYDWADAVMLSGETAVGEYPDEAVSVMARVALEVDISQSARKKKLTTRKTHFIEESSILSSLCDSADELADEIGAKALITFTDSGRTPLLLSKYRSSVPIVAITSDPMVCSRMALYRGVWPVLSRKSFCDMQGLREMLEEMEKQILDFSLIKKGELIVIMAGTPIACSSSTNMIRVHRLGEPF